MVRLSRTSVFAGNGHNRNDGFLTDKRQTIRRGSRWSRVVLGDRLSPENIGAAVSRCPWLPPSGELRSRGLQVRALPGALFIYPGGFAPPDPPARSLARCCATLAPFAWLVRCAHSRGAHSCGARSLRSRVSLRSLAGREFVIFVALVLFL